MKAKTYTLYALSIILMYMGSCATKAPEGAKGLKDVYGNDCLPQAIAMCEGLRDKGIDADVLALQGPSFGHAVCVYMYPRGENQLWVWDAYWGSNRLNAYRDDAQSIANAWGKWQGKPELKGAFLD
jgi:hypothetical protein